ncbi:MAG TPA: phage tail tube protein [Planctomycetota bacterium]|nr:phage tail tube protein [Thermoleophilia bacterium]HUU44077.1 phage tail tube protein [Planctomycetota bacterium]
MTLLISDLRVLVIGDNKVLVKDGTASVAFGGFTNTPVLSGQEVVGFTRQGTAAEVSVTCAVDAGTDIDAAFTASNVDIRMQTDTGDEWLMRSASNTDPPTFSGGAGDVAVTYNGKKILQTKKGG